MRPGFVRLLALAGGGTAQAFLVPRSGIVEPHSLQLAAILGMLLLPVFFAAFLVAKAYLGRVPPLAGAEYILAAAIVGPLGAWASIDTGHNAFATLLFWFVAQMGLVVCAWFSIPSNT